MLKQMTHLFVVYLLTLSESKIILCSNGWTISSV